MIELNFSPSKKILGQFKWFALFGFTLAAFILAWKFGLFKTADGRTVSENYRELATWQLYLIRALPVFGLLCFILALINVNLIKPVYILLSLIAYPIGMILGTLVMIIIFYIVIMPIALLFKIVGRDELRRQKPENTSSNTSSYWHAREPNRPASDYYKQF